MSSLSSASTLDQIKNAYLDSASYAEDNSPSKARTFITACRMLMLKLPQMTSHGKGGSITLNVAALAAELAQAKAWLATHDSTGGILHVDLTDLRG